MLFGHWMNQKDIPDPYGKSHEAFEFVYRLLADSAQKWVKALILNRDHNDRHNHKEKRRQRERQ